MASSPKPGTPTSILKKPASLAKLTGGGGENTGAGASTASSCAEVPRKSIIFLNKDEIKIFDEGSSLSTNSSHSPRDIMNEAVIADSDNSIYDVISPERLPVQTGEINSSFLDFLDQLEEVSEESYNDAAKPPKIIESSTIHVNSKNPPAQVQTNNQVGDLATSLAKLNLIDKVSKSKPEPQPGPSRQLNIVTSVTISSMTDNKTAKIQKNAESVASKSLSTPAKAKPMHQAEEEKVAVPLIGKSNEPVPEPQPGPNRNEIVTTSAKKPSTTAIQRNTNIGTCNLPRISFGPFGSAKSAEKFRFGIKIGNETNNSSPSASTSLPSSPVVANAQGPNIKVVGNVQNSPPARMASLISWKQARDTLVSCGVTQEEHESDYGQRQETQEEKLGLQPILEERSSEMDSSISDNLSSTVIRYFGFDANLSETKMQEEINLVTESSEEELSDDGIGAGAEVSTVNETVVSPLVEEQNNNVNDAGAECDSTECQIHVWTSRIQAFIQSGLDDSDPFAKYNFMREIESELAKLLEEQLNQIFSTFDYFFEDSYVEAIRCHKRMCEAALSSNLAKKLIGHRYGLSF